MSDLNIHASPEFLNSLDWQLRRLSILIESVKGLEVSLRDFHEVLNALHEEALANKYECW